MNAQDFFELVRKMRVAQRGYFATRAQGEQGARGTGGQRDQAGG